MEALLIDYAKAMIEKIWLKGLISDEEKAKLNLEIENSILEKK